MKKSVMQTYTGKLIDLANFRPSDVRLPDISHALASINRFTGHCRVPYSVAQHSVLVSELTPPEHALWGLLHDASEAYLGDVATPLKSMLPGYRELEESVQRAIATYFGLGWPVPAAVHLADKQALLAEKRDLVTVNNDWGIDAQPAAVVVVPCGWAHAKDQFEKRFKELYR
jgi:5'-deoxynucleotidase YfbR-like HD superfamily hydrolase